MATGAKNIALCLGKKLYGQDLRILRPLSLSRLPQQEVMVFVNRYDERTAQLLNQTRHVLAIVPPEYDGKIECSYILSQNPRLDFARAVSAYYLARPEPAIADTARIGSGVALGDGVSIGHYCLIGDHVVIGDHTVIGHHVVIDDNISIGTQCRLKSHCVIGEEGFGFEYDEQRRPVRIPHLGSVTIGNRVEVGAGSVIARGTLENTVIEDDVKIDDQVFVAHNVVIGRNSLIIAGAEISGSVRIGENCWIGPQCSILNKVTLGDNCRVGMGTVVIRSMEDGETVAGNPARVLPSK